MVKVSAKLGKDKDAKSSAVEWDLPEKLSQIVQKYGEDVVTAHVRSSFVISLQSYIRGLIKKGESQANIQKAVNEWKPGVRVPGKSAVDKAADALNKLSPEERKQVLEAMKKTA